MENVFQKVALQILLLLVPGRLMEKMPVEIIVTVVVRMNVLKVAKIIMVLMPVLQNAVINVTIVILLALREVLVTQVLMRVKMSVVVLVITALTPVRADIL